jgi:hypothetical protein
MDPISKADLKDRRYYIGGAVETALANKNFKKLADLVDLADKYGVNKRVRFKSWKAVGVYWMDGWHFADASIAFNSARRIQPLKIKIVKLQFDCLGRFVREYRDVFSFSDLSKIEVELERILEFYKTKKLWNHPAIKGGRGLFDTIIELKSRAKEAIETPATHITDRIVDALYTNVSMDEVRADFARIITPYLLEKIAEDDDKAGKKKKKKKPPIEKLEKES